MADSARKVEGAEPVAKWWRGSAAAWLLILLGVALRLRTYFSGRALRRDEAMLTLNLLRRTFAGLLLPLDDHQGAPLGFLMLEKLSISVFGNNEYALRLVPLLAGLAALPLGWVVATRLIGPGGALIALAFLATAEPLIYYASETKQYSVDLAVTLALLAVATSPRRRPWSLGLVGAAAVWFSHPSMFVLGGIALAAFVFEPRRRVNLTIAAVWASSFFVEDSLFLKHLRDSQDMQRFWANSFMPLPPRSLADLRWFSETILNLLKNPLGFTVWEGLAAGMFCVGVLALVEGDRKTLVLMLTPVSLALVASGLRKYPFSTRLILFTAPLFFNVIAAGFVYAGRGPNRERVKSAAVLLAALMLPLAFGSLKNLVRPLQGEELKQVMNEVQRRRGADDGLYVYFAAERTFRFYTEYADRPILRGVKAVVGRAGRAESAADVERLQGLGRVWCLFSHVVKVDEQALLDRFDASGRRLDEFQAFGASAYLYEF